jgi:hypothetical protein
MTQPCAPERVLAREEAIEQEPQRVSVRGAVPHGAVGLLGRRPKRRDRVRTTRAAGPIFRSRERADERRRRQIHRSCLIDRDRIGRERPCKQARLLARRERSSDPERAPDGLLPRPRAFTLADPLGERPRRRPAEKPHAFSVDPAVKKPADPRRSEREQPIADRLILRRQPPNLAQGPALRLAPRRTPARR